MLKNKFIKGSLVLGAGLILAACGNGSGSEGESAESGSEESTTLTVGASNTPHAEILEFVEPTVEEQGVDLEIETYTDYVIPNQALDSGDIDANYFQHIPFFENAVEENGYDFANVGSVHLEPIAGYSQEYSSLEDLPDGADVLVSNNAPDHGRVLTIFEEAGLITLEEGVDPTTATFDDIAENPKNLNFDTEYDPALMPTLYEQGEGDIVFINSNFAVDYGLNPIEDAVVIESESSPYANIVATRSEDEDSEAIQILMDALQSEETAQFIEEEWAGLVVPASGEQGSEESSSSEESGESSGQESSEEASGESTEESASETESESAA